MGRPSTCRKVKEVAQGQAWKDSLSLTVQAERGSSPLVFGGTTEGRHRKGRRDLRDRGQAKQRVKLGQPRGASVQPG